MKFNPAYILAPALLLALMGCEERYRYPCQDPENWKEKICQKPYCSANGTCPEDLTHYEKDKVNKGDRNAR
jgi:hypothetical protein